MPLVDAAGIEDYLRVSAEDAARIAGWIRPAARYLRDLKGGLWYDAIMLAPTEPPEPGVGPDAANPEITILAPAEGETVRSPVLFRGTVTDDVAVTYLAYTWIPDGGNASDSPYRSLGVSLPSPLVQFSVLLGLPQGAGTLRLQARDAAGAGFPVADVSIVVEGQSDAATVGEFEYVDYGPTIEDRKHAENAEALLALYYALPQLNLRLDPEGGVLSTVWTTDEVTGARTQTQFAGSERLDTLRGDLLQQAKLLVMGGVRVEYGEDAESTVLDGVESFTTGGGGYVGYI